jgi:FixJ family two-component response regulator
MATSNELRSDSPAHILIVDDEAFVRNAFQLYFESLGFRVSVADGGESALAQFAKQTEPVEVVLLDLVMPGIQGLEVLERLKKLDESVEVIIATGCGSMNSAIEALRHGAYDYITKPILNFDEDLLTVVRGAVASHRERLRARGMLAAAAEPDGRTTAIDSLDFYAALEELAQVAARSSEEALAAAGTLLERRLGAVGAVAIEQREFGGVSCLARWGILGGEIDGEMLLARACLWPQILEPPRGWKRLRTSDPPFDFIRAGAGPLEALRVPLVLATRGGRSKGDLYLFRRPGGPTNRMPPALGLLALVFGSILSRATEESLHPAK